MKNLIIGTNKGMPFSDVELWAKSGVKTGHNVLMILMGDNLDVRNNLTNIGVEVIVKPSTLGTRSSNNERFFFQNEVLKSRKEKYTIMTDSKDVIFQKDPFDFVIEKTENYDYDLVCASEGLLYKDEPWGNMNLMQSYPELYHQYKNNPIMNVGVIGGPTEKVANVSLDIYNMTKISKTNYHSDQSSFNVLCADERRGYKVYQSRSEEGFAVHCGTMIQGVTDGAFNLSDKNKNLLLEPPAVVENGIVKTHKKEPYLIVHQWNRVPRDIFINKNY